MARLALNADFAVSASAAKPVAAFSFRKLLGTWYARWQERRELASLDQRILDDIGLSRSDVYAEVSKPFWRA